MYVVAIGWIYVVGMAAIAEAMSPQGTWLGALMTFVGWGVLPLALVLYILGTPARKRRLREQNLREQAQAPAQAEASTRQETAAEAHPAEPNASSADGTLRRSAHPKS